MPFGDLVTGLLGGDSGGGEDVDDGRWLGEPGDPAKLESWQILAAEKCQPWVLAWGLGRLRGALREAEPLAFNRLPGMHWRTLQRIDYYAQSTGQAVATGRRPTAEDIKKLANAVHLSSGGRKASHRVLELAHMKKELPPDVALRVDRAMGAVEQHARFVFGYAYPCREKLVEKAATMEIQDAKLQKAKPDTAKPEEAEPNKHPPQPLMEDLKMPYGVGWDFSKATRADADFGPEAAPPERPMFPDELELRNK